MTVIADDADDEDKVADDSVDDDDVDDDELIISCYHANALSVPSRSRFLSLRLMPPTLILKALRDPISEFHICGGAVVCSGVPVRRGALSVGVY